MKILKATINDRGIKKGLITLCLIMLNTFGFALVREKTIRFKHLSNEDGLSQATVNCILQDKKGFMWIGTQKGLNRYDGYEFKVYKTNINGDGCISDNWIMCIYEDSQRYLWIGTKAGGLNKFYLEEERFEHFEIGENIEITAIYEDKSGVLWIGTKRGGLKYFDRHKKNFHSYLSAEQNSKFEEVSTIYEDNEGMLWIGTENGLYSFDRKKQLHSEFSIKKKISAICEDQSGILWIGTEDDGLFQWNFKTRNTTPYKKENRSAQREISDNHIQCIYKGDNNVLWVGTRNGLNKINQKSGEIVSYKNSPDDILSLSDDDIRCIFRDKSGIYWFGTGSGGISIYNEEVQKFKFYSNKGEKPYVLSNKTVSGLYEDQKGLIWISVSNGGLNCLNRETGEYTYYLGDKDIQCIKGGQSGTIWIGTTNEGLIEFNPETGEIIASYEDDSGKPGQKHVMVIYESPSGNLWIGTNGGGISKFDRKKRIFNAFNSGLSNEKIRAILEDNAGVLWVGTYGGGLNRLKPGEKKFISYRYDIENTSSLSSNRVKAVYEDKTGKLWIGTDGGGLNYFRDQNNKKFVYYSETDGLPDDTIYGILEDEEGNLWMSTNRGISRFNPKTKKFNNYDTEDGLQGYEFCTGAYFKSVKSGEMFFGGVNGFNSFLPAEIEDNKYIPPVVITDFFLKNKVSLQWVNIHLPLTKSILETDSLILSYEDRFFSFDFAALHYANPLKNRYKYKLEGLDEDWIETDAKNRRATYTNLPAGEYTFRVQGSNKDGVWNKEGTSIRVKILPPWWQTGWAYSFYVMAVALFLLLIWAAWSRWFLKRKVEEKTQKLKEAQGHLIQSEKMATVGTLLAGVAHELKNPSAYIKMNSEYFLKAWKDIGPILDHYSQTGRDFKIGGILYRDSKEDIEKLITGLMDGSNRIEILIEELKNLSKKEEPLKKELIDLNKVIQSSINLTRHDIGKATNNFSYKLEDGLPMVYGNSQRLERVFINLIQNSCQALTNNNQGIFISTTYDKSTKQILIQVKDEGIGIDEKNLKYITDPFFTTKRVTGGIGLGLFISSQIIREHGGSMRFESEPVKGTTVSINFPTKPFSRDEKNLNE